VRTTRWIHRVLVFVLSACSSSTPTQNGANGDASAQADGGASSGGDTSTGSGNAGGATVSSTSQDGVLLYGSPYSNVNMWLGPVDFAETQWHNACGLEDGSTYPTVIQNLYGNYLIGLDGENIPNVESHCDDCAQLTANGKTIIAHIVTYGVENGVDAIDLSPEARSALGLSNSNWTGTWQFCSCPTDGSPIYYEFDSRQWSPQNFWYMRIWTRNQHLPVTMLETKLGSAAWVAASQQSDGAWQTQSGVDFSGGFQVRVTAIDSQQLVDTIPAPTGLNPANPIAGKANFQ
jgi:expansin (peptidoglycan-binding protein)